MLLWRYARAGVRVMGHALFAICTALRRVYAKYVANTLGDEEDHNTDYHSQAC